jgi:DNA-directed RNA polymerase specialized sigma24 family protein
MHEEFTTQAEDVLNAIFGTCPDGVLKMYGFYESRIPERERADFLSLVAIELLESKRNHPDTANVESVIKTTFERVSKRLFRAAKRHREREKPLAHDVPSEPAVKPQNWHRDILEATKDFEPQDILLVLMRLEGHTLEQVAKVIGVPPSTTFRHWTDVLKRLRVKLGSYI